MPSDQGRGIAPLTTRWKRVVYLSTLAEDIWDTDDSRLISPVTII